MHDEPTVDGQQMFLLDDDAWDEAMRTGSWSELALFSPRGKPIVEAMLRFARAHRDAFSLALCKDGAHARTWTAVNLLATRGGWQRVHIERVECGACGTQQIIANPAIADLYLGVKDWAEAMKRATAAGSWRCVRCNGALPRFAAWTEALGEG